MKIYHYTSLETLLQILKNKTLRFTSLGIVDDMIEGGTEDYGQLGRFCYVSCWTEEQVESIPQWNMYSSDMSGVRISISFNSLSDLLILRPYSFDDDKYINIPINMFPEKLSPMGMQPPYVPEYFKVTYTEEQSLLKPKVYNYRKTDTGYEENVQIDLLGKFKSLKWQFQNESRFKFFLTPWSLDEMKNVKTTEEHLSLFKRLKDTQPMLNYLDLDLNPDVLSNIEITMGPKISEEKKEILKLIVDKYCPNVVINESNLEIR